MASRNNLSRVQLSIFFLSMALIAYEILLIRMFTIQYWYHFASLIISIALLGFGASGTAVFIFRDVLRKRPLAVIYYLTLCFLLTLWITVPVSNLMVFNPLMMAWHLSELYRFSLLCCVIFLPFFVGALAIGTALTAFTGGIHRIYGANLTGSGAGSLIVLLSLFRFGPAELMLIIALITVVALVPLCRTGTRKVLSLAVLCVVIALYPLCLRERSLPMSDFKDLARAEQLKGAKREFQTFGPLGFVSVVDSPAFHYLPDLSLNCEDPLPRQKGLFLDGNRVGAIHRFAGNWDSLRFMDCRTVSLPYRLLENPEVLIIGGGGGTEILNARYHGARHISVVEINRDIIRLMKTQYREYSGGIYEGTGLTVFAEEGRGYLDRTDNRYDLIQINIPGSADTPSTGIRALNENYVFTVEALAACLTCLRPGGMVLLSRGIESPPREGIKLLAMAIRALEDDGRSDASRSILMIRSWQRVTLLLKKGPFGREAIASTKRFCGERFFDLCYYPGMKEGEANRYNRMDRAYFYGAAQALLSDERETFYERYPFHIRPATDDSPFFSSFFKLDILKRYCTAEGRTIIPFIDWGYMLVWFSLILLLPASLLLIIVPVRVVRRPSGGIFPLLVYFGSLGLAYIFLEMAMLQQFIRFLHNPVMSASVVICSFLVYSGVGSMISGRLWLVQGRHVVCMVIVLVFLVSCYLIWKDHLFTVLSPLPLWGRMLLCSLVIAPVALPMGIPFPSGLTRLAGTREYLIPWAWGINGFFSVIGATAAVIIAVSFGFTTVMLSALCLYIVVACAFFSLAVRK